jgi:hypothetical protein
MSNRRYIRVLLSDAPKFCKGFTSCCTSCGSVFALPPKTPYCPICNIYTLNNNYKQELIKDELTYEI